MSLHTPKTSHVLSLILVVLAFFIPLGYGYYIGLSFIFNYNVDFDNISLFKLHIMGLNIVIRHPLKITLYLSLYSLAFAMFQWLLQLLKKLGTFFTFFIFIGWIIISMYSVTILIWLGYRDGIEDAKRLVVNYTYNICNRFENIPAQLHVLTIEDDKGNFYNGFILDGTAINGIIYAAKDSNERPAVYIIYKSHLSFPKSFPINKTYKQCVDIDTAYKLYMFSESPIFKIWRFYRF